MYLKVSKHFLNVFSEECVNYIDLRVSLKCIHHTHTKDIMWVTKVLSNLIIELIL